jgi:hypothetical protein
LYISEPELRSDWSFLQANWLDCQGQCGATRRRPLVSGKKFRSHMNFSLVNPGFSAILSPAASTQFGNNFDQSPKLFLIWCVINGNDLISYLNGICIAKRLF